MKPVDFVKALGVAILGMVLDFACAFGWVSIWAWLNVPAEPLTPNDPIVIELSTVSTRVCGPILLALFVWFFSRKRPDRNAYGFALAVVGFYMLIDWGTVAFQHIVEPAVLLTAALKLFGALVGAFLARLRPRESSVA